MSAAAAAAAAAAEVDTVPSSMANVERADEPAQTTEVATRVAAILDMIEEHRGAGRTISARRAAVISAMIDDVAATAAEGRPRACRRKRRMASARGYKQEGRRLAQGERGGVVVRARHRATGQLVAVKSLHRRSGGSYVGDVLREACFMAAGRGHPSLAAFRTVARSPGTTDYSIVTDYVGPSLSAVMRDRAGAGQPFSEAEVRRVMRRLLAGAETMHGHGVVHRDIKPDNILVGDGGGAVTITNYGAAKSLSEHNAPHRFAGTLAYMAPEVLAENADHGALVDAWSLGCVMAELLAGKPPFAGKDEADQLFRIFDVIGAPCKRVWQALEPQAHGDKVQVWRARQLRRGHHGNRLRELFPDEKLSMDGFRVLKGLLTCDPEKRLTAAAALRFPWFTENVDDDAPPGSGSVAVTKIAAMASMSRSLAVSFVGRVIALLRPKALLVQ